MYNDKVYHKKNFTDRTGIVPRDDAGLCHPQSRGRSDKDDGDARQYL